MDTLTITILFITISTAITTIIKAIKKDKCLKDFKENYVTLIETNNDIFEGKFRLESTGFELIYKKPIINEKMEKESSYIMYKSEFQNMKLLARFHTHLTKKGKKKRLKELKKSYHPNFLRKFSRRFLNFLKTIKNTVTNVVNLLLSQAKKIGPKVIKEQNNQISKIKNDMIGTIEAPSFDPLLEYHIGNIVILETKEENDIIAYRGVLKEYTTEFFEIMDVKYVFNEKILKADLIISRQKSIIKHYGE